MLRDLPVLCLLEQQIDHAPCGVEADEKLEAEASK